MRKCFDVTFTQAHCIASESDPLDLKQFLRISFFSTSQENMTPNMFLPIDAIKP